MRRFAAAFSDALTPSTWLNRARALRTWPASLSGILRSLGNANLDVESLSRFFSLSSAITLIMIATLSLWPESIRESRKSVWWSEWCVSSRHRGQMSQDIEDILITLEEV